jgi:predicted PurR-regulated permease PerM
MTPGPASASAAGVRRPVPVKTILAAVGLALAAVLAIEIFLKLHQILLWVAISGFFAVVLHPAVNLLVRRAHLHRTLAAIIVFLFGMGILGGAGYAFVRPIAAQLNDFVNNFPTYVADAKAGRGTIGHLVKRYGIDTYVERNQAKVNSALKSAEKPAVRVARMALNTVTALATIVVVTFLMLIEGPRMMQSGLGLLSPPRRAIAQKVMHDTARALAGYVAGNLLTGILAGGVCYLSLVSLGVPFAGVLSLWVGFTVVVPLVGAVIGAVPAVTVAFIHSTPAGVAMIVVFVVYQQIENRTFTKWIMRETVALTPLAVVVSVLVGFELVGFLGALLAIPAAGVINVAVRDLWAYRAAGTQTGAAPATGAGTAPDTGAPGPRTGRAESSESTEKGAT